MKTVLWCLMLVMVTTGAWAEPPCWQVRPTQSALRFSGDQAGAPARGRFRRFTASFCFDPAAVRGRLDATVRLASLDSGNSRRDQLLRSRQFFDVQRYPLAEYRATTFLRLPNGHYVARGRLTLHGVTRPLSVTFRFHATDGGARVQGEAVVHRLEFGVGSGRWYGTRWVGDDVALSFTLALTAPHP